MPRTNLDGKRAQSVAARAPGAEPRADGAGPPAAVDAVAPREAADAEQPGVPGETSGGWCGKPRSCIHAGSLGRQERTSLTAPRMSLLLSSTCSPTRSVPLTPTIPLPTRCLTRSWAPTLSGPDRR